MKSLLVVGAVVLILGLLSFFVPIPHYEHTGSTRATCTSGDH